MVDRLAMPIIQRTAGHIVSPEKFYWLVPLVLSWYQNDKPLIRFLTKRNVLYRRVLNRMQTT